MDLFSSNNCWHYRVFMGVFQGKIHQIQVVDFVTARALRLRRLLSLPKPGNPYPSAPLFYWRASPITGL